MYADDRVHSHTQSTETSRKVGEQGNTHPFMRACVGTSRERSAAASEVRRADSVRRYAMPAGWAAQTRSERGCPRPPLV